MANRLRTAHTADLTPAARSEYLTLEMVNAIRAKAHELGEAGHTKGKIVLSLPE